MANIADHFEDARALNSAGRLEDARALCEKIVALDPNHHNALHLAGLLTAQTGDFARGAALIARAIAVNPDNPRFYINQGLVLEKLGRTAEALASYDAAILRDPNRAAFYSNRGIALHQLQRFEEALASYCRALEISPSDVDALSYRGNALCEMGRFEEALVDYDRAIALQPDSYMVHVNRGGALYELNRCADALACFEAALALKPDCVGTKEQCFSLGLMQAADATRIEKLAVEIAEHHGRDESEKTRRFKTIPDYRLLHDFEQTTYLLQSNPGLREVNARLGEVLSRQDAAPAGKNIALTDVEADQIARFRERVIRHSAPALAGPSLNPDNDWAAIEDKYFNGGPELVVIDNILSAEALQSLRSFSLASTIWRREYPNQYLGAFGRGGFVSPLHLQIANELRQKMPRIFSDHALEQMWGFKYTSSQTGKGINVHADFGRVNLNFWITPDDANLDPRSGGMIVYDVPAPTSWGFQDYNGNPARVRSFLKERNARAETVPYKFNRAVLFNSNLFHETDAICFKEGYENRRINVTYLFGRGLAV